MHCTLFFSSYPYSFRCQLRLRNRHINHISRHKNSSNLISQQQILAIHGSRKNPLPPSINKKACHSCLIYNNAFYRLWLGCSTRKHRRRCLAIPSYNVTSVGNVEKKPLIIYYSNNRNRSGSVFS